MALIADGLLIAGALVAAIYCHVLARRLRRLRDLDAGLGGAIAALSRQVEEMRRTLESARQVSGESVRTLAERTARAEVAAGRLELLLATLHERGDPSAAAPGTDAPREEAPEASAPEEPEEKTAGDAGAAGEDRAEDPREAVAALRAELARAMRAVAGEPA